MPATAQIPVNWVAFLQRLNRHLSKDGKTVYKLKQQDAYYILDTKRNQVVNAQLNATKLERMARDLGLVQAWEEVRR